MFLVNGTGTRFYGRRDVRPDGYYTTTKWFVILFIPVLPIASYRVLTLNSYNYIFYSRTGYLSKRIPLNLMQVFNCYAASLFAGIPLLFMLLLAAYALLIYPFFPE